MTPAVVLSKTPEEEEEAPPFSISETSSTMEASYKDDPIYELVQNENDAVVEKEKVENDHDENETSTFYLFSTIYLPVLLLWVRRSLFGTANLVRSLVLGHVIRMVLGNSWDSPAPEWFKSLSENEWVQHVFNNPDPNSWPPPACTALAIITVIAFVIHPDGLTWILLEKIRTAIFSFVALIFGILATMKDSYGIVPTLFALSTFAGLLGLAFIMYKTLTPKRPRPPPAPQKKKKKRGKGGKNHHHRQRHRHHHHGASTSNRKPKVQPLDSVKESLPLSEAPSSSSEPTTLIPPPPPSMEPSSEQILNLIEEDYSIEKPKPEDAKQLFERPGRARIHSGSTLDSLFLVDDQSLDSTSLRSVPSTSLESATSLRSVTPSSVPVSSLDSTSLRSVVASALVAKPSTDEPTMPIRKFQVKPTEQTPYPSSTTTTTTTNLVKDDSIAKRNDAKNKRKQSRKGKNVRKQNHHHHQQQQPSPRRRLDNHQRNRKFAPRSDPIVDEPPPPGYSSSSSFFSHGCQRNATAAVPTTIPEKNELAAFLARVGLDNTAFTRILADLPNVDALEQLSPYELFNKYDVNQSKQQDIQTLLMARRRLQIRPPPGLLTTTGSACNNNNSTTGINNTTTATTSLFQQSGGYQGNKTFNGANQFRGMNTELKETSLFQQELGTANHQQQQHVIGGTGNFEPSQSSTLVVDPWEQSPVLRQYHPLEQDVDSFQIEQELQELGGQMVTSVLDSD